MLIETASTAPQDQYDHRPTPAVDHRRALPAPDGAEIAAHEARTQRIDRALDAIDALSRRRRAQELVEAIERLGAGLQTTAVALDEAVDAVDAAVRDRPAALPAGPQDRWTPISVPLVPITAVVAGPGPRALGASPQPAAVAPAVPQAPVAAPVAAAPPVATAPAAPVRETRQAPDGLAAFVIDFAELSA